MFGTIKAISVTFRVLFKNPINIMLVIIPTLIALGIYVSVITYIFTHSDYLGLLVRDSMPQSQYTGLIKQVLTAILVLFVFLLMNWTYVIVVGIIAAPFNSILSARVEKNLLNQNVEISSSKTLGEIWLNLKATFINESKKLIFVLIMGVMAFILNLFPLFYPLGLLMVAILFTVQFIDYTWSRHNLSFKDCLGDLLKNLIPYSISGFFFLIILTVPIINALVPAYATGYYTVLWLYRQKKLIQ